jgi:hypothetical protein
MTYTYKMIQIPPEIRIQAKNVKGQEAAIYLETIVAEQAKQGWEFYRVDAIGVEESPGCIGGLLGQKTSYYTYYVVSFRRTV